LADGTIRTKGCGAGPPEPVVLSNVNVGLVYVLEVIALQMQCAENSKKIFPEMKLRGLVPISKGLNKIKK
jgi:hypothetical protein